MPYRIEYTPEARRHVRDLTAVQRSLVLAKVGEQLQHQPTVPTRNRKQMLPNALAEWELRIQNLRVLYRVYEEPQQVVLLRAIGVKVGNRLFVQGEEVKL